MSRPRKPNPFKYVGLYGFTVAEKCKAINACPREVYHALVASFRSYLRHFYVDLSEDLSLFDLLAELDYWRIDGFSFILTSYGVNLWLCPGRYEYKYLTNF